MNSLFTFILSFRGGTYISQVESNHIDFSIKNWIEKLEEEQNQIQYFGPKTIEAIKKQMLNDEPNDSPTLLNGLLNVWCFTINTKQGFGIINVVKTEKK